MSDEIEHLILRDLTAKMAANLQAECDRAVANGSMLTGNGCQACAAATIAAGRRALCLKHHDEERNRITAEAHADDLPLFTAPPEPSGPYKVPGLSACGQAQHGDWLQFWAEAPRPLHSLQDREQVMRELAVDPDLYSIKKAAPITKGDTATWRTFWYAWPRHLPSPGLTAHNERTAP